MRAEIQQRETGRDAAIDLLKTVAILGVIVIHTCVAGFAEPVGSFNWFSAVFWGSLVRASVPIFFLCSGALLLPPERPLTARRLYTKNFPRIVAAMLVWALAYKFFHLAAAGGLSVPAAVQAVKEVLVFKHENHLYYLQIMVLVYACLPVTRSFVRGASQNETRYALAVWFLLGIVYPTVKGFWPFTLLGGIPLQWQLNMTWAAIGYGLLGYVLRQNPIPLSQGAALAAAGFLITFGGTAAMSLRQGRLYTGFLEGMSVGVALLAAGLFGLCVRLAPSAGRAAAVRQVSKASFCVYLVHILYLDIFASLGLTARSFPCILSIPLLSLLIFAASFLTYLALSRIPVVRAWLL